MATINCVSRVATHLLGCFRPSVFLLLLLAIWPACGCDRGTETKNGSPTTSGPGGAGVDAGLHKVRLGLSPFQDTLVPMVGVKMNWFREEGLDVDVRVLGWTEVQEALAANGVDVAINNISGVISTWQKDPQIVYAYGINTFDDGFALMIRPNGPLKSLSDFLPAYPTRAEAVSACAAQLKGKTVITTSKTDMEQGVAAAARRGKLDFVKDITIRDFNPDEGLAAFLTGAGDAYIGGIPQRTRAAKEGMIPMMTGADLGPPPINGFVTSRTFATDHRDDLLKVLKVWFRCVQYIDLHPNEGGQIIVDELNSRSGAKFTLDDFKKFWNNIEHYPADPAEAEAQILSPMGRNYWRARWDDCNQYFSQISKTISKPVDPEGVFIMPDIQRTYVAKYGAQP